jgi:serine/threonine protein kinase
VTWPHTFVSTHSLTLLQTVEAFAARLVDAAGAAQKFGRYRSAHHFSNGLFSRVFVAKAPDAPAPGFAGRPGAFVALKATHLSSMVAPHNSEREVRILRKAAGPSVVALWENFYDGAGHLVLVFPFLPWTLEHFVRAKRPFDRALKGCLVDVFKALEHLHSLGIIHRDVKPSNVLMKSPDGPAYLADFGIAWCPGDPASESASKKITDVGTTCYRAPEVMFGCTAYDTSFDLWAAGCVVAEVVAANGKTLFEPGDVGTDLTLILSLFENLGTPNPEIWPVSVLSWRVERTRLMTEGNNDNARLGQNEFPPTSTQVLGRNRS